MPRHSKDTVAVLGIDIGKNTFHLVGLNKRGAIILRQKLSRTQLEAKLANLPSCLVGMEACVGAISEHVRMTRTTSFRTSIVASFGGFAFLPRG